MDETTAEDTPMRNAHTPGPADAPFARVLERLAQDLIGPRPGGGALSDYPIDAFATGILFPPREPVDEEEPAETEVADAEGEERGGAGGRRPPARPGAAGLSFALETEPGLPPEIEVAVTGARYRPQASTEPSRGTDEASDGPARVEWHRVAAHGRVRELDVDEVRQVDLAAHGTGLDHLRLSVVALRTPANASPVERAAADKVPEGDERPSRRLVTVFVENRGTPRREGEGTNTSRNQLSEEALFEFRMAVRAGEGSRLVPRSPIATGEAAEARAAALLWHDVAEYATGHTCAAHWDAAAPGDPVEEVATSWLPCTKVAATSSKGADVFGGIDLSAASLADASGDLAALDRLLDAYERWIARTERGVDGLPPGHRSQAHDHLAVCRRAAARMRNGVEALGNPLVRRAFALANDAMARQWDWANRDDPDAGPLVWRPFQIGFVLLALASTIDVDHADREVMDLVWFPTGGGKTEAYLLLSAFAIFARRLKAPGPGGAGVTVIMRYTLRLLSIQQFERAAAMILAAELVRRGEPDMADAPPVSLGLWLGLSTTPNKVSEAAAVLNRGGSATGAATPAQLSNCPCCGSPIRWDVVDGVVASCTDVAATDGARCPAADMPLPIHTVDEDIYRHQPSLVIGTADKFAQIARNASTATLFGLGISAADGGVGPPDLIVQDELHLISGPLGTLAGLYETAVDRLCEAQGRRPKIVGSTATIRRAEAQVRALFDRGTIQFPPPGIHAGDSGFAVTDHDPPGRLYVGVTTAGRSKPQMLQTVAASLLQSARDPELSEAERDACHTLVMYFNSLRELGGSVSSIQIGAGEIIDRFARPDDGADASGPVKDPTRDVSHLIEITSRVAADELKGVLKQLERPADSGEAVDLALATNMISVGLDVTRLGLMVVDGQPKGVSEYIQATSRVGRGRTPGLVVGLFNAYRTRDRSRFETHRTWHMALYREVEATSVTPFAPRARDRALHAPFAALAAHLRDALWGDPAGGGEAALHEHLEGVRDVIVRRARAVDADEAEAVSLELDARIGDWLSRRPPAWWDDGGDALLMSAEWAAQRRAAGRTERAAWATPNSLRGVEATVNIHLNGR